MKERQAALRATAWTTTSSQFEVGGSPYPGMSNEMAQPVPELRALADSPLETLLFFMPKSLWVLINDQSNLSKLVGAHRCFTRGSTVVGSRQSRRFSGGKNPYETHEILHVVGLLVARVLCPQKRRFADHWSMVEDGAIPAGNFGRFMGRNRCQDILRDLHSSIMRRRGRATSCGRFGRLSTGFSNASCRRGLFRQFSNLTRVLPATSKRNTTHAGQAPSLRGKDVYDVQLADSVLPQVSCFCSDAMS